MDKVFDVEIDGQVTLPDGSTLGPLEETTVNVVQPSEGDTSEVVFEINVEVDEEYGDRAWSYKDGQGRNTLNELVRENGGKDILIVCVNIATGAVDDRYVISKARGDDAYADGELKAYSGPICDNSSNHYISFKWLTFFRNGDISQGSYTVQ